jgi:hypothetical protein
MKNKDGEALEVLKELKPLMGHGILASNKPVIDIFTRAAELVGEARALQLYYEHKIGCPMVDDILRGITTVLTPA